MKYTVTFNADVVRRTLNKLITMEHFFYTITTGETK